MSNYNLLVEQTTMQQSKLLEHELIQRCFSKKINRNDYVLFLKQAYHHVKNTVPLLMLCGGKLSEKYDFMRHAISHYIEEEIGHELWILNDLQICGVLQSEVVGKQPLLSTDVFVCYIYDIIQRKNPIGLFGMIYVLESTSVLLASKAANHIKDVLALPDKAFSYLYSHGDLDKSHMRFFEQTVNKLDCDADIKFIIDCTNHLFELYANIFSEINMQSQAQSNVQESYYEV